MNTSKTRTKFIKDDLQKSYDDMLKYRENLYERLDRVFKEQIYGKFSIFPNIHN